MNVVYDAPYKKNGNVPIKWYTYQKQWPGKEVVDCVNDFSSTPNFT